MRFLFLAGSVWAAAASADESAVVLAHPPFASYYACAEHSAGQFSEPGDALGTDCTVQRLVEVGGRLWVRAYAGEGLNNEDWYGWNVEVLSPCTCSVTRIHENPTTNKPGIAGQPPASYVLLKQKDGTNFMLAHVQGVTVREGEQLRYGQPFARVGNNGYSRQPHIHIGAWKADKPLQIRFDQKYMKQPKVP